MAKRSAKPTPDPPALVVHTAAPQELLSKANLETFSCITVDGLDVAELQDVLDERQERELSLALNRIRGTFDTDKLRTVVGELRGMADIWVSSENTDMQLARYHDRSVSGLVRYLGARKNKATIVEDSIGDAVAREAPTDSDGRRVPVNPGSVIATDAGQLTETHGVKRIYHAATVQGTPGRGYQPVANITVCITTALSTADQENKDRPKDKLKSILFPVFGAGVAQGSFRENAKQLIQAAINYVENHGSSLEAIYFLAYDRSELTACLDVLEEYVREGRLLPREA